LIALLSGSGGPFKRRVGCVFLDGGEAEQDLLQAIVAQGPVADLCRGLGDGLDAGAGGDQPAHFLGDENEFVEGDAFLVAGLAAGRTALAAVERHFDKAVVQILLRGLLDQYAVLDIARKREDRTDGQNRTQDESRRFANMTFVIDDEHFAIEFYARGRVTRNSQPRSGRLKALIVPRWTSTIL
jgi:hypothetical protein